MEHTAHVEQQLTADQEPSSVEIAEECLARLVQMQEQLRKAPQNTIREGNELLRALEQVGGACTYIIYMGAMGGAKCIKELVY